MKKKITDRLLSFVLSAKNDANPRTITRTRKRLLLRMQAIYDLKFSSGLGIKSFRFLRRPDCWTSTEALRPTPYGASIKSLGCQACCLRVEGLGRVGTYGSIIVASSGTLGVPGSRSGIVQAPCKTIPAP